jgi:hypothetical protein
MAIGNGVLITAPPPNGKEHSGKSTAPEGGFPESDGCALRAHIDLLDLHRLDVLPAALLACRRNFSACPTGRASKSTAAPTDDAFRLTSAPNLTNYFPAQN